MIKGTEKHQQRVLGLIGGVFFLCVVLAVVVVIQVDPLGGRPKGQISVVIDTPYLGQGVEVGTAVVLHGVEVGKVTDTTLTTDGRVRLSADLQERPVAGLTDAMQIDYRPINYFGVPGINIDSAAQGNLIGDGSRISVAPKGDFTVAELLSQLGDVSAAALTPQLITAIDRVTRYTDGLNPLFETMLTVTKTVADTQTVPTDLLVANAASITAALPDFAKQLINVIARFADFSYYPEHGDPRGISHDASPVLPPAASGVKLTAPYLEYTAVPNTGEETEDFVNNKMNRWLERASGGLFAAVGQVLTTHSDDLIPLVGGITSITDTVPTLLKPADFAKNLTELRSRFERLYAGNGEQRALQVRILLDSLPGVASTIGVEGVPRGGSLPPPPAPAEAPPGTVPAPAQIPAPHEPPGAAPTQVEATP